MHSVGIIGFGRFGKILSNILQRGFDIKIYDKNPNLKLTNVKFVSLDEIVQEKNIFIAVALLFLHHNNGNVIHIWLTIGKNIT